MFIQQGKTNWIMIIVVALAAGAVGGVSSVYINDTIRQTTELSRVAELKKPGKANGIKAMCAGEGQACGQLTTECDCGTGYDCDCIALPVDCCSGMRCEGYDYKEYPSVGKCVKNEKEPGCDQACKDIGYVSGRIDEHAAESGESYCVGNKEINYPGLQSSWIDWVNVSTDLKLCCCLSADGKKSVGGDFNLVFKYGIGGKNVLDTFKNKFTKDMIMDPAVTVDFKMTPAEMESIKQKIKELDLFSKESKIQDESGIMMGMEPCSNYYFKTQDGASVKEASWDNCTGQISGVYQQVSDFMINLIESKKEYKDLPAAQGGYL